MLLDLNMGKDTPSFITAVSDEYLDTLESVMDTLPEKERTAVLSRYKLQMTYDEIGSVLELTGARASQVVGKGMRLLRHPSRCKLLRKPQESPPPEIKKPVESYEGTIPALPLSSKAANCLLRGNMWTVDDILKKTPEELAQIWGMGRALYAEIVDLLDARGHDVCAYRTYLAEFDKNKYIFDRNRRG